MRKEFDSRLDQAWWALRIGLGVGPFLAGPTFTPDKFSFGGDEFATESFRKDVCGLEVCVKDSAGDIVGKWRRAPRSTIYVVRMLAAGNTIGSSDCRPSEHSLQMPSCPDLREF